MMIPGCAGTPWASRSVSWIPSMIGIFTSVSTMSGSSRCASSSPCLPSPAVPMTSMSSSNPSSLRRLSRVLAMSSTMRSRIKSIATSAHGQACCLHRVDVYAGPHGRGDRHRLHVRSFRAGRFGSKDGIHQGGEIVAQFVVVERSFTDCGVDDARSVIAELDASALDVLDRLGDVEGHRAGFRVGHQPARSENLAQPPDHAHHLGSRERDVEVDLTALHLLHQVLAADHVGPRLDRLAELLAGREDRDAPGLAGAVGQGHRAPDHLVGMSWIDAEADVRLDRRIERRDRGLADEAHRLGRGIELPVLDRARRLAVLLAVLFGHLTLSVVLADAPGRPPTQWLS